MPTESFNHLFPGYEILGELGRSNARVLSARNILTGELVAIKHFSLNVDAETLRRFQRESDIMTSIKNPNVVKIKDIHLDAELPYIVMELIEGGDLRSLLRVNGQLNIPTVIRLGLQMAEAFKAIHEKGIIHRDIKPENIMYRNLHSGELHFLLTDFGIAKLRDSAISVTGAGMMTYEYASPEQFTDSTKITAATDYYSLGVVLYECITGNAPFKLEEGKLHTHINNVISMRPPAFELAKTSLLPPTLVDLINGLLSKQPDARPAEFVKMKKLLKRADMEESEGIIISQPLTGSPATITVSNQQITPPAIPKKPAGKKGAVLGATISFAVFITVIGLLYFFTGNKNPGNVNSGYENKISTDSSNGAGQMTTDSSKMSSDTTRQDTYLSTDKGISLKNGIYYETFDSYDGDWKTYSDMTQRMGVDVGSGKFIIKGLDSSGSYNSNRKFNINTANDFSMYVTTSWMYGSDDNGFGINFCSDDNSVKYFTFFISANGWYKIAYLENGVWNDIKAWTQSNLVRKRNDTNIIGIEKRIDTMFFYINGQEVEKFHFNFFYGSDFGFRVGGIETVAFDDLVVKTVP